MAESSILLVFAPRFKHFGCDVGKEYVRRAGGGRVHGLCTGPSEVLNYVKNSLGPDCGRLWHLHSEEKKWLTARGTLDRLSGLDDRLGPGAFGRIVVADRRVGRGFVRGGLCRPDNVGQEAIRNPVRIPQQYVLGLVEFLDDVLAQTQPDVVFCYAVAGAPALALAELCRSKGVPFTHFTSMRFHNRIVIDDDGAGKLACIGNKYRGVRREPERVDGMRQEARELLQEFRRHPEPPGYAKTNQTRVKAQSPLHATRRALVSTALDLAGSLLRRQNRMERIARRWFEVRSMWRRILINTKPFTARPPADRQFIFYPLHVDPEASTMVLSPWHTDQLGVIEALAKSAPAEMTVVVKEHAPMLGKRPRGFYETISRMPRVVLVGPETDSLSLIQQAALTVVITGTAAWEAVRLGRPALVIGDSPFLALGEGLVHEPCLAKLPGAIREALSMPPASDEAIELYLAVCLDESFEMPGSLLWGRYEEHGADDRQAAVKHVADGIMKRMEEARKAGI